MSNHGASAQVYHDNLAGARARGTSHEGRAEPVITNEARQIASKLLDDPIYLLNLRRALRKRTAGPIEIWLWRWKLGDPPRAEQATEETDRKRFEALRQEVRTLIRERPAEHKELEDRVLAQLPAGPPVAAPVDAIDLVPEEDEDDDEDDNL